MTWLYTAGSMVCTVLPSESTIFLELSQLRESTTPASLR